MTEIAAELLEDVKPGDHIRVRYGTITDQSTVAGTVIKWNEHLLTLKKADGTATKIRLDDLRALDSISPASDTPTSHESHREETKHHILRQMVTLSPADPFTFVESDHIALIHNLIKNAQNAPFKQEIRGVLDSLDVARKQHNLEYKYHDLRARTINLWPLCHTTADFNIFYTFLGILAILAKDYEYSLEPLVRAHRYTLASYAATMDNLTDSSQVFTCCALLSGESKVINKYISEICVTRRDVDFLKSLLQLYKNDTILCEQIASCCFSLFTASHGQLSRDIVPYDSAYTASEQLLAAIPNNWSNTQSAVSYWEKFRQYSYPELKEPHPEIETETKTGRITKFSPEGKWGFISNEHYFYISQVLDNSEKGILLRKLLASGLWKQLEVSFLLGTGNSTTHPGAPAATDIQLTENGYQEALCIVEAAETTGLQQNGFVEVFFPNFQYGRIQANGRKYNFKVSDIVDPWLKAYYNNCYAPKEQDVSFEIMGNKAVNICWRNPSAEDREEFSDAISRAAIDKWNQYLAATSRASVKLTIPKEDPYATYTYFALPEWEPKAKEPEIRPLTWGGKSPVEKQSAQTEKKVSPPQDSKNIEQHQGTASFPSEEAKNYAAKARQARLHHDLDKAALLFEKAMAAGGFDEKVLSDYVTVLQQLDRVDDGLKLLEQFEPQVSKIRLVNLQIGLYEKKKDYQALVPLYNRAFQTAATVSTKSHSLTRLLDAYVKLEKYDQALETCKRWETFFSQNRYSTDAEKLRKASGFVARHKAYSYYFLGRVSEAREIATSLIRSNPADAIANSILDGTLEAKKIPVYADGPSESIASADTDIDNEAIFDDDGIPEEEASDENQSQFSRFVRYKIQQSDLSAILKSKNLRDGKYTGSIEEGLRDVKFLVNRTRISSKARSDSLFAACKLLEQLEQISDVEKKYTYRKIRFAGRAMSAWGDVMVSQLRQLDTTRMAYLYALKVLTPNRNSMEQGWADSYNRYIKSFFLAQNGKNSLEEYITAQTNQEARDSANTDVLINGKIADVLLPEFMVGMLLLIDTISNQPGRQASFLDALYTKNVTLRHSLCSQLEKVLGTPVSPNISKPEFSSKMKAAVEKQKTEIEELDQRLSEISTILLRDRIPEQELEYLDPHSGKWRKYLTATDFSRLGTIYYNVRRTQDYYNSNEFESRADTLRSVLLEINNLQQTIQSEPTDVSYDIFLPMLEQMSLKLTDKQTELYQSYLPRISMQETIQPYCAPTGAIEIQLTISNELNYQTADSLRILGITGPEIVRSEVPTLVQSLRGGEETEVNIRAYITPAAKASGSFTAVITYTYRCSDAPQNMIDKNHEAEFTFVIRDKNFTPLVNPFSAYEGHVMEDENMFFGRSTQIDQITDTIHTTTGAMNYGRAVVMYGQTRTGKTSLLYHVVKRLREKYADQLWIWNLGNCGKLQFSSLFMENFVCTLLSKGQNSLEDSPAIAELLIKENLLPPIDEARRNLASAVAIFNDYLEKLNKVLRRENKMVVLVADEFTYFHGYIKEGKIPHGFMNFWKALLQDSCIFVIIAGQDDMPEFTREYPNDFGCMELMKLNYLAEEDTKRLIREPLERTNHRTDLFRNDGSIDEIYKLTAGSAYLTIILCSKLVNYLNGKGAYVITKGIIQDFLRTYALSPNSFLQPEYFEPQIDERGQEQKVHNINKEILLSVARLSQTNGYAPLDAITCGSMSQEEMMPYINRLVDRNVLVREGRDGYWIYVKLLEKWLIATEGV